MLEGKCENWSSKRCWVSLHENRNEQEQNKDDKKNELREMENQKKNDEKERWIKRQWKMIFHEMILGLITLKHNLGLSILSFKTMNLGPHYIPKKFILIECGYLDWRVSSLRIFFCVINKAVVSFPQLKFLINHSPVRDEFLSA